jgi:UPF0755 protein
MMSDSDPPGRDDPPQKPRADDEQDFFDERPRDPFRGEPPRDPFQDEVLEPEILPPEDEEFVERDTAPLRDLVQSYRQEARRASTENETPSFSRPPQPSTEEREPYIESDPVPPRGRSAPREKRGWFGRKADAPPPSPPPPPLRRGNKVRKPMSRSERSRTPFIAGANAALTILIFTLLSIAIIVHYGIKAFDAPGPLAAETDVAIPRGSGPRDISERLEQAGAISSSAVFVAGTQLTGNRGKLQAGEYRIPAQASMRQIMEMMAGGKVVEHTVTVPEGLTSKQIVNRLLAETTLSGPVREVPPEGTLLPETYKVTRGTSREALLQRMASAQNELLDEIWAKRDPKVPVNTPQELVTLASIVEKETGIASERPRVASVFVNRLNKKMRLQSDPTIIYGLVQGTGTLGRPILRSEITKPTPYNTYTIPGLPPGPIANPGRESMEAVANPADTKDLYFVADGSGGHAFAATLAEHNANVARWRAVDQADTDRAPIDAVPPEGADPAAGNEAPAEQPRVIPPMPVPAPAN